MTDEQKYKQLLLIKIMVAILVMSAVVVYFKYHGWQTSSEVLRHVWEDNDHFPKDQVLSLLSHGQKYQPGPFDTRGKKTQ